MERQMSEMTEARKAQMRALVEAATPGPWEWEPHNRVVCNRDGEILYDDSCGEKVNAEVDAAFIAAARSFVPDALAHIERLEGENERWKAECDRVHTVLARMKTSLDVNADALVIAEAQLAARDAEVAEIGIALTGLEIVPSTPLVAKVQRMVEARGDAWSKAATAELEVARLREWYRAIDEASVCWHIAVNPTDDPTTALHNLISMEVQAALDPKVSAAARDLVTVEVARLTSEHATLVNALADKTEEVARLTERVNADAQDRQTQTRKWMDERNRVIAAEDALATLRGRVEAAIAELAKAFDDHIVAEAHTHNGVISQPCLYTVIAETVVALGLPDTETK